MLKAEIEKAQKALAEAKRLDTGSGGEVSAGVREAQLRVDALGAAAQAAHHDAAAAEQRAQTALEEAQTALEEAREAHAKEHEELVTQLATFTVKDEPSGGAGEELPEPDIGEEGHVHTAVVDGRPITVNVQTRSLSADEVATAIARSGARTRTVTMPPINNLMEYAVAVDAKVNRMAAQEDEVIIENIIEAANLTVTKAGLKTMALKYITMRPPAKFAQKLSGAIRAGATVSSAIYNLCEIGAHGAPRNVSAQPDTSSFDALGTANNTFLTELLSTTCMFAKDLDAQKAAVRTAIDDYSKRVVWEYRKVFTDAVEANLHEPDRCSIAEWHSTVQDALLEGALALAIGPCESKPGWKKWYAAHPAAMHAPPPCRVLSPCDLPHPANSRWQYVRRSSARWVVCVSVSDTASARLAGWARARDLQSTLMMAPRLRRVGARLWVFGTDKSATETDTERLAAAYSDWLDDYGSSPHMVPWQPLFSNEFKLQDHMFNASDSSQSARAQDTTQAETVAVAEGEDTDGAFVAAAQAALQAAPPLTAPKNRRTTRQWHCDWRTAPGAAPCCRFATRSRHELFEHLRGTHGLGSGRSSTLALRWSAAEAADKWPRALTPARARVRQPENGDGRGATANDAPTANTALPAQKLDICLRPTASFCTKPLPSLPQARYADAPRAQAAHAAAAQRTDTDRRAQQRDAHVAEWTQALAAAARQAALDRAQREREAATLQRALEASLQALAAARAEVERAARRPSAPQRARAADASPPLPMDPRGSKRAKARAAPRRPTRNSTVVPARARELAACAKADAVGQPHTPSGEQAPADDDAATVRPDTARALAAAAAARICEPLPPLSKNALRREKKKRAITAAAAAAAARLRTARLQRALELTAHGTTQPLTTKHVTFAGDAGAGGATHNNADVAVTDAKQRKTSRRRNQQQQRRKQQQAQQRRKQQHDASLTTPVVHPATQSAEATRQRSQPLEQEQQQQQQQQQTRAAAAAGLRQGQRRRQRRARRRRDHCEARVAATLARARLPHAMGAARAAHRRRWAAILRDVAAVGATLPPQVRPQRGWGNSLTQRVERRGERLRAQRGSKPAVSEQQRDRLARTLRELGEATRTAKCASVRAPGTHTSATQHRASAGACFVATMRELRTRSNAADHDEAVDGSSAVVANEHPGAVLTTLLVDLGAQANVALLAEVPHGRLLRRTASDPAAIIGVGRRRLPVVGAFEETVLLGGTAEAKVRFVVVDGACDDRAHAILGKPGIDTLSLQYVGAPGGGRVTTASGDSVPLVQARHVHASAAVAAHGPHACRHCGWTGNSRNALFKHIEAAHDPDCRRGAQHRCGHGGCTHVAASAERLEAHQRHCSHRRAQTHAARWLAAATRRRVLRRRGGGSDPARRRRAARSTPIDETRDTLEVDVGMAAAAAVRAAHDGQDEATAAVAPARAAASPVPPANLDAILQRHLARSVTGSPRDTHTKRVKLQKGAQKRRQRHWRGVVRAVMAARAARGGADCTCTRATTKAGVDIAPGSERAVRLDAPVAGMGGDILLEPTAAFSHGAVRVTASVCRRDALWVRVANLATTPLRLRKGQTLAQASQVDPEAEARAAAARAAAISLQRAPGTARQAGANSSLPADEDDPIEDRIARIHFGTALSAEQKKELEQLVREYADVVSDVLQQTSWTECAVPTEGSNPAFIHQYPLSRHEQEQQRTEVARLVKLGVLERIAHSLWNSPQLLVEKKPLPDGHGGMLPAKWRVVADFRAVNERLSFTESFPLPHIPTIMSSLQGCKFFSATDALHGYWAVPIKREDRHKTAVSVTAADGSIERFQYTRMPMGLASSAAVYQALMTRVCAHVPGCRPYLDDALLGHESFADHASALRTFFEACRTAGITLKPAKMYLGHDAVKYLGMHINQEGMALDDEYVSALHEKPPPDSLKSAQRLVGALNWCRDHCVGFADKMRPIYEVIKPGIKWRKTGPSPTWGAAQEAARKAVMTALEKRIRLAHPRRDGSGKMLLFCDASTEAVGAVLLEERQRADGTLERVPLGVFSQKLSAAQQQYAPTALEAYAVLAAVRRFRHHLHGPKQFDVHTDHASLAHVTGAPHKSGQLCRWKAQLLEYNMNIVPRKGSSHDIQFADYWSRGPFAADGGSVATPPAHHYLDALDHTEAYMAASREARTVCAAAAQAVCIHRNDADAAHVAPAAASSGAQREPALLAAQQDDIVCIAVRALMAGAATAVATAGLSQAQSSFCVKAARSAHEDAAGVLCTTTTSGHVAAVLPASMRAECLAAFHDAAGHPMGRVTHERVSRAFVWPQQRRDAQLWVESCPKCRSRTPSSRGIHAAADTIPEPGLNFDTWYADISGPFELRAKDGKTKQTRKKKGQGGSKAGDDGKDNDGKRYNLSFVCAKSRWVECAVIEGGVTASACLAAFVRSIVRRFGTPKCIVTDNGLSFRGVFAAVLADMGIMHRRSSPYGTHTGTSLVERWHRSMWTRIATTVPRSVDDWNEVIQGAAAHFNMTPQSEHGVSPFTACFRQRPLGQWEASMRSAADGSVPSPEDLLARRASDRAARTKRRAEGRAAGSRAQFRVHDAVWSYLPAAASPSTRKLLSNYVPGIVTKVLSPQSYEVRHIEGRECVQRKIEDLRERTSRADLVARWDCEPPNLDRDEPGWDRDAAPTAEHPPALRAAAAPKLEAGMRIVVGVAMPGLASMEKVYDGRPVAMAGTITSVATNGRTRVRWVMNAQGTGPPPSYRTFTRANFQGICDEFHPGSFGVDKWAVYEGVDLEQSPILAAIVARRARRDFTGHTRTEFVARGLGLLPDCDVVASEDEMAALFPTRGKAMMQRFVDTCVPF